MKKRTIVGVLAGIMLATGVMGCADPSNTNSAGAAKTSIIEDKEDTAATEDSKEASDNPASEDSVPEEDSTTSDENTASEASTASENDEGQDTTAADSASKAGTIQDEIAGIEAKSQEFVNSNWDNMSQTEMNITTSDWYKLWDDELNSLWKRITDEEKDMTTLLENQRAWIKRKEAAVKDAGADYEGGTIQPQLEASMAEELTRVRVYYLAGYLAKLRGETFTISDDIQKSLDEQDPSLESVFAKFEGEHIFDINTGHCLRVEKAENSDLKVDGAKWIVSVSMGDTISDLDVDSYAPDSITFHVNNDGRDAWYRLSFNMEYSIQFAYGKTLDTMDEIITCE